MKQTVLFVPGFQEEFHSRNYAAVLRTIENAGYAVEFVDIRWKRRTIDDWVAELLAHYARHDPAATVLAGFSFGAMTALTVAARRPPAQLWLFSLSPYFTEDLPTTKTWWLRSIGKQRTAAFSRYAIRDIAPRIPSRTLVFIGAKEIKRYADMEQRSKEAVRLLPQARLIVVPGAGHAVDAPSYVQIIGEEIV